MSYTTAYRQFDAPRTHHNFLAVPKQQRPLKGWNNVYFTWDSTFPAHRYTVATTSNSVSAHQWRGAGPLSQTFELPLVFIGPTNQIALIPDSPELPNFVAPLHRGMRYTVPKFAGPGTNKLVMSGTLTLE